MRFLFLEPFFGGSHRDFAEGLVSHSRHEIDLVTLPARFWKWRMRGAALHFFRKVDNPADYDGLITSALMGLSDFKMLTGPGCPPALVYFHENQITYPLAPGEALDVQFGFTDITTGLAADRILFNSRTHMDAFFGALPGFLRMMPEHRPRWVEGAIRDKSAVCPPGCRFPGGELQLGEPEDPPIIIWNHRWEFDKNPEAFFAALEAVEQQGLDFRLALLGENFQVCPKPFLDARERFQHRLVQYGYAESRSDYESWLRRGSIVVSTALQENFGLSVVEAIRHGCLPLLPNRLAYPEVLPKAFHADFIYRSQGDLEKKLARLITETDHLKETRQTLSHAMGQYAWENIIEKYDDMLESLAKMDEQDKRPASGQAETPASK
jgi:glycosyltransferase involved in cell wall biosynthesis